LVEGMVICGGAKKKIFHNVKKMTSLDDVKAWFIQHIVVVSLVVAAVVAAVVFLVLHFRYEFGVSESVFASFWALVICFLVLNALGTIMSLEALMVDGPVWTKHTDKNRFGSISGT
jgi:hypothetical protein